jgi:hypothetical protein
MLENHKADPGDRKTIYKPVEKIGRGANIYLGVESGKIETRRTQHTVHKGRIRKLGFAEINKIDLLDFFHPPNSWPSSIQNGMTTQICVALQS